MYTRHKYICSIQIFTVENKIFFTIENNLHALHFFLPLALSLIHRADKLTKTAAEIKCRFFQRTELGGTWLAMGQATEFPICNSALFPDRLARPRTRARANVMEML